MTEVPVFTGSASYPHEIRTGPGYPAYPRIRHWDSSTWSLSEPGAARNDY